MARKLGRPYGPSLYYASDKNILDALNQHKVKNATIAKMFMRRNIIVGKGTKRSDLAQYFSTLHHNYHDHQDIAQSLGVVARKERMTSVEVIGLYERTTLSAAIESVKKSYEEFGDTVHVSWDGDNVSLTIAYSTVDYSRSEFCQRQERDAVIQFVKSDNGYLIRSPHNEYANGVVETFVSKAGEAAETEFETTEISLFDVTDHTKRSKFFWDLSKGLDGYERIDVTGVHLFKPDPSGEDDEPAEYHVDKVALRGKKVSLSEFLGDLGKEEYYIVKLGWQARDKKEGHVFDLEASFSNHAECTQFSFILKGVFVCNDGDLALTRRTPQICETHRLSEAIELKARSLAAQIRSQD